MMHTAITFKTPPYPLPPPPSTSDRHRRYSYKKSMRTSNLFPRQIVISLSEQKLGACRNMVQERSKKYKVFRIGNDNTAEYVPRCEY